MLSVLISVFFRQPKIYHENCAVVIVFAHQKIVWLDVPMNEAFRVDVLDTVEDLKPNHEGCLRGEATI